MDVKNDEILQIVASFEGENKVGEEVGYKHQVVVKIVRDGTIIYQALHDSNNGKVDLSATPPMKDGDHLSMQIAPT